MNKISLAELDELIEKKSDTLLTIRWKKCKKQVLFFAVPWVIRSIIYDIIKSRIKNGESFELSLRLFYAKYVDYICTERDYSRVYSNAAPIPGDFPNII